MSEHTKGPWTLAPFGRGVDVISDDDCGPRIIAECKARNGSELESCEANARLIAAAPSLLAACKAAKARMLNGGNNADTLRMVRAAIAKAQPRTS